MTLVALMTIILVVFLHSFDVFSYFLRLIISVNSLTVCCTTSHRVVLMLFYNTPLYVRRISDPPGRLAALPLGHRPWLAVTHP